MIYISTKPVLFRPCFVIFYLYGQYRLIVSKVHCVMKMCVVFVRDQCVSPPRRVRGGGGDNQMHLLR